MFTIICGVVALVIIIINVIYFTVIGPIGRAVRHHVGYKYDEVEDTDGQS